MKEFQSVKDKVIDYCNDLSLQQQREIPDDICAFKVALDGSRYHDITLITEFKQ